MSRRETIPTAFTYEEITMADQNQEVLTLAERLVSGDQLPETVSWQLLREAADQLEAWGTPRVAIAEMLSDVFV